MKEKTQLLFLAMLFLLTAPLVAQEVVDYDAIYIENDLAYRTSNQLPFSGAAQKVRKNGHLVHESYYQKGILTKSVLYYNNTEKPTPANTVYYFAGTDIPKKSFDFSLDESVMKVNHFNKEGEKELSETYENEVLVYKCTYLNGKKHGTEFCIKEDGTPTYETYQNGKRVQ